MAESVAATPQIIAVIQALKAEFPNLPDWGLGNCRAKRVNGVLRPDLGYSQHAYGNAWDIGLYGVEKQKPIVDFLNAAKAQGLPVGTIIWAGSRADHKDHIHLEGSPSISGTPACVNGGKLEPNARKIKPGERYAATGNIDWKAANEGGTGERSTLSETLTSWVTGDSGLNDILIRSAWFIGGTITAYLAVTVLVRASAGNVVIENLKAFGGKAIAGK